jgi:hypothetical protein
VPNSVFFHQGAISENTFLPITHKYLW